MKIRLALLCLLSAGCLVAASKEAKEPKEPTLVLPTFVVLGTRIPDSWLEVSWECKGPFPIDRIKRAWISKVQSDSPPARAGFKVGDALLVMGGVSVETMTGFSLQANLKREHEVGTKEEFVLKTAGEEKRTVVIVFENK